MKQRQDATGKLSALICLFYVSLRVEPKPLLLSLKFRRIFSVHAAEYHCRTCFLVRRAGFNSPAAFLRLLKIWIFISGEGLFRSFLYFSRDARRSSVNSPFAAS